MSEQTPAVAYQPVIVQQTRANGFGVAALILGIIGLAVGIIPLFIGLFLSFLPTLLAITFGIVGIVAGRRRGLPTGLAIAGLVLGGVTFLLWFTGYGIIW